MENLGKIGHSGSGEFLKKLGENPDRGAIIGQVNHIIVKMRGIVAYCSLFSLVLVSILLSWWVTKSRFIPVPPILTEEVTCGNPMGNFFI